MAIANIINSRVAGLINTADGNEAEGQPDTVFVPVPPGLPVGIGWYAVFMPPLIDWVFSPPPPVVPKIDFILSWPDGAVDAIPQSGDPKVRSKWALLGMVDNVDLGLPFVIEAADIVLAWLVSQQIIADTDVPAARARILKTTSGEFK
jgi:hypothetical protein